MAHRDPEEKRKYAMEYARRRRAANPARAKEISARWYKRNRAAILERTRKWRAENREHRARYDRARYDANREWKHLCNILWRHGLTLDQYHAMMESQSELCAICRGPMKPPHIDHDHQSNAVRGLLCGRCNPSLGSFRDDPNILRAAIAYLDKHRQAA